MILLPKTWSRALPANQQDPGGEWVLGDEPGEAGGEALISHVQSPAAFSPWDCSG